MIEKLISFQIGGYYGGEIGRMLAQWEMAGVFSYVLPFLLIFALTYGILTKTNIFHEQKINAILALCVALLSLQFHFVPMFFAEIFPRVGVGIAVILSLIIIMGLFLDEKKSPWFNYTLFGVGVIIFIVVISQTFGGLMWGDFWWRVQFNWPQILGVAIFIGIILWIIKGGSGSSGSGSEGGYSPLINIAGQRT